MSFKGIFIDDTEEAAHYASLLSTPGEGGVTIEYQPVTDAVELAGRIFASALDLVVLDFRLDENLNGLDPKHSYLGSGLAQLLRDKAIARPDLDFPIVLVSAEEKFEKFYRPDSTAHDLFDRTYGKEHATEVPDLVAAQIHDLCVGYRLLKETWADPNVRMSIFSLRHDEREVIENQEIRLGLCTVAAPHLAANFVLRSVIDRAGILLSDNDVIARLGISSIEPVVDYLTERGVRYEGIFGKGWRRWWTHRFNELAEAEFGRRPTTMTGEERASILRGKLSLNVDPAISRWNKSSKEKFAVACASCSHPTEIRHSVSAFDPNVPRFAQAKRICWDCIQTDRNLDQRLDVDDVDAKLSDQVKNRSRDDGQTD